MKPPIVNHEVLSHELLSSQHQHYIGGGFYVPIYLGYLLKYGPPMLFGCYVVLNNPCCLTGAKVTGVLSKPNHTNLWFHCKRYLLHGVGTRLIISTVSSKGMPSRLPINNRCIFLHPMTKTEDASLKECVDCEDGVVVEYFGNFKDANRWFQRQIARKQGEQGENQQDSTGQYSEQNHEDHILAE